MKIAERKEQIRAMVKSMSDNQLADWMRQTDRMLWIEQHIFEPIEFGPSICTNVGWHMAEFAETLLDHICADKLDAKIGDHSDKEADLRVAEAVCRDYLNHGHEAEFTSTREANRYAARVAEAASTLIEIGNEKQTRLGNHIQKTAPALWDYNEAGDYVGAVANENGWTP